jgi:LmbE family N-acetylglucosaminyl deacetylase
VPFRLLGIAADPEDAGDLCGQVFARYAGSGTEVTLLCVGAPDWNGAEGKPALRRLGIRDAVLLDYQGENLESSEIEDAIADLMASLQPHVVVVDDKHRGLGQVAASAFIRLRQAAGGSGAFPGKLYQRTSALATTTRVTTAIAVPQGPPELFIRLQPAPWVTGVLERDLFAGLKPEAAVADEERLAS